MAYSKERRLKYIQQGLCGLCGKNQLVEGLKECEYCCEKRREWQKNQYHKKGGKLTTLRRQFRIRKGLCGRCGKRPFLKGKKHCEGCLKKQRDSLRGYKDRVFKEYGGYKCCCCEETIVEFLTLDHIDNNGAAHRKFLGGRSAGSGRTLYLWIINNNFPRIFQVLCYNCNCGRARNGGVCPHKTLVV